jgi:hypothetical protein
VSEAASCSQCGHVHRAKHACLVSAETADTSSLCVCTGPMSDEERRALLARAAPEGYVVVPMEKWRALHSAYGDWYDNMCKGYYNAEQMARAVEAFLGLPAMPPA